MSKLKENIDRILGNSIRCLMPSYWWKRIFGLVVDEVEDVRKVANSKANKSVVDEVDALSKRVDTIINSGNNIFPDMPSNAMSLIQSVEAGTFEPRASGGSATTSYKIYKDLNAFIAVIGSRLYIYDLAAGDFKGVTFLGGIYLQTNNELTKLSNAIHYNLVLGDWILGADCFMLDANTGDSYGVTYGNGSVFSFTYEKNGYEYTDRLNPDGTLENISFNKPKSTPTFLLYYPYTTRNDVYTMHESFIEHNATELPKIKNSINNKEGYILNVVAAGTSATDVQTMQDVDFHYLGYGTGNTGGLVVITSQFIPIYRAVQPNRLFLGFKEDGSCEVKEIAVGDTLYLYYSEDYGFNFTDAEKAANAENIIPIWNSLDESFTPRPIIIRHKVNDTPTGSGNYLSIPAVLTGVDTTGTNIILVGCFSPGRFLEYQYNRTTGEFVSLKEITIEGGEGSYDDTGIKKDIADLQAKDTQHDAKLAELSAEISGESLQKFEAQSGVGYNPNRVRFPINIGAGKFKVRLKDDDGILSVTNVPIWLYDKDGNELLNGVSISKNFVEKSITSDAVSLGLYASAAQVIKTGTFYIEFDGETIKKGIIKEINDLNEKANKAESVTKSFHSLYYAHGTLNRNEEVANDIVSRSMYLPVKKGDVVSSYLYRVKMYDENRIYIGEDLTTSDGRSHVDYTINNESCKFVRLTCLREYESPILINGEDIIETTLSDLNNPNIGAMYPFAPFKANEIDEASFAAASPSMALRNAINNAILGLWLKNPNESSEYYITQFLYRAKDANLSSDERTYIIMSEKKASGEAVEHILVNDLYSSSINNGVQKYESKDFVFYIDWSKVQSGFRAKNSAFTKYNKLDDIVRKKNNTIYLTIGESGGMGGGTSSNLDGSPYIAMPIPQLAMVNIVGGALPTNKTDDISAILEFNDMQGNVFVKKIIINAQGNSSLGLAKKNFSIDIMDENYEDSHEIKFGDWVAQDGFHLKSYMLDGIRVKPMAVYDFYESMLLTRGVRKDRAWKRLQLPTDIPMTSNEIADSYLQIDSGAKNHPSGFPVIVYHNGVFYGIYCWQLKKHRANYHQEKKDAAHIHLDGNISNTLLWNANGVIDWGKWSGKTAEADNMANYDGIEIRNPKTLILTDGTEYDGDTNRGELISKTSVSYDSSNKDMKRTADVRESLENLSRRVYALTQMAQGAEKKSAIAEVFDVDSIIDYIIFGQITGNQDGYKKNWQWVTYDGQKWAVNASDLDGTWGWTSWSYYAPYTSWLHNDTPPVTLIIENYLDEIKARYKELRDKGVIDLAKIMQPLVNYVKVIGIDYYNMEYEKWTEGARDNLWRFESWMEESIKRTDALMDYNKAA